MVVEREPDCWTRVLRRSAGWRRKAVVQPEPRPARKWKAVVRRSVSLRSYVWYNCVSSCSIAGYTAVLAKCKKVIARTRRRLLPLLHSIGHGSLVLKPSCC